MSAPVKGTTECRHRWVSVKKGGEGVEPPAYWRCRLCGKQRSGWWEPVPVRVVNEARELLARALYDQDVFEIGAESMRDFDTAREEYDAKADVVLAVPLLAAAFEARAQLQNAPNRSKDLELAEAQAKLEAAEASLRMAHEVLSITTNYLLGQGEGEGRDPDECRALATNEALAGFERLDAVLLPVEEGGEGS